LSAFDRWRGQLEARAIPEEILAAAPVPPWGYPPTIFRTRAERSTDRPATPTTLRALEALPEGGTVLDVGCGGGATSIPLASRADLLVGVDGSPEMLETFRELAGGAGVKAQTIEGTWPDAAERAPICDVVVCGHVFFNVADLEPFVRALDAHARVRVAVELTERHPLAWMNDLWLRFHGVRMPEGPTADDAQAALGELGIAVHREDRHERGAGGFEHREDAVALARRRLCLRPKDDARLIEALGPGRLARSEGLWSAGPKDQVVATLWWDRSPDR
jgi:SAM-dependent methyltransferase